MSSRALAQRRQTDGDQVRGGRADPRGTARARPSPRGPGWWPRRRGRRPCASRFEPKHLEGAVLQHAQQLDLRRPARGRRSRPGRSCRRRPASKRPLRSRVGVGERALDVPEQLALEQRRRDAAEVDLDERAGRRGGCCWWSASATSSLPVPLSPGDQHGGVGRRRRGRRVSSSRSNAGSCADDAAEVEALVQLLAASGALGPAAASARLSAVRTTPSSCSLSHGLVTKSNGAGLDALHRQRDRAPGRDQDHRHVRAARAGSSRSSSRPSSPVVWREKFMSWMTSAHGSRRALERLVGGADRMRADLLEAAAPARPAPRVVVDDEDWCGVGARQSHEVSDVCLVCRTPNPDSRFAIPDSRVTRSVALRPAGMRVASRLGYQPQNDVSRKSSAPAITRLRP